MLKNRKAERLKEELRRLAIQPGNKVCMNCPVRGPLYAVIDFNIFVCTNCSAIHRSLQHKVKGISMSEFSDEEVAGLRVGGNERAARIWRVSYPYGVPREGDERAIRSNITMCFVERRYFDAVEHEAMQLEQVNASLPPVTTLPPGITLVQSEQPAAAPAPAPVRVAAPAQPQQQPQPQPQVAMLQQQQQQQAPQVVRGTVVGGSVSVTAQPVAVARPAAPAAGGFDDFFGGAPASSAHAQPQRPQQQAQAQVDFFAGPSAAPTPQVPASHDFFGGPSASAAAPARPQQQQQQHVAANDFFSGPSTAPPQQQQHRAPATNDFFAGPSPATQQQQQQQRAPAADDFFGGFSGQSSAPAARTPSGFGQSTYQQPQQSHSAANDFFSGPSAASQQQRAPAPSAPAGGDFFGGFSGSAAPAPTNRPSTAADDFFGGPSPQQQQQHNQQNSFFGNTAPQPAPVAALAKNPSANANATDAFAALYSFK